MILRTLSDETRAQASYLVGCSATGEALVIDPHRHIDQYRQLAQRKGLRSTAVTETHIHADVVSGARELAQSTGAQLYLSDRGPAEWKYLDAAEAGTHLARLRGSAAMPLTLLAQRTRATAANAGRIHDAQAAIGFSTPLLGEELLVCWTPEGPIRLERKILA